MPILTTITSAGLGAASGWLVTRPRKALVQSGKTIRNLFKRVKKSKGSADASEGNDTDDAIADGSLADGSIKVVEVIPTVANMDNETLLSLSASAKTAQSKPIKQALNNEVKRQAATLAKTADAATVGDSDFLSKKGYEITPLIQEKVDELSQDSLTALLVGIDGTVSGIIAVEDPEKTG